MIQGSRHNWFAALWVILGVCAIGAGCQSSHDLHNDAPEWSGHVVSGNAPGKVGQENRSRVSAWRHRLPADAMPTPIAAHVKRSKPGNELTLVRHRPVLGPPLPSPEKAPATEDAPETEEDENADPPRLLPTPAAVSPLAMPIPAGEEESEENAPPQPLPSQPLPKKEEKPAPSKKWEAAPQEEAPILPVPRPVEPAPPENPQVEVMPGPGEEGGFASTREVVEVGEEERSLGGHHYHPNGRFPHLRKDVPVQEAPKECKLTNTGPYVIQPPDILLVESPRSLPDQPISGEHLVRMDGTISLGLYGSVHVAGLTIDQARESIERHLAGFIKEPKVNVDVYSYNSKYYYIISDGAGFGQQVIRLNFTGNETVLDAMSQIGGLPSVASKKKIWIARPDPEREKSGVVLPVDWLAIAQCGETATNYQLFPGDRIYIQSDRLLAFDAALSKVISPIERVLGVSLLGAGTVQRYQNMGRTVGAGGVGGF